MKILVILNHFIVPDYIMIVHAINIVAKYSNEEKVYGTPAVAANLSTLIKYIGNFFLLQSV